MRSLHPCCVNPATKNSDCRHSSRHLHYSASPNYPSVLLSNKKQASIFTSSYKDKASFRTSIRAPPHRGFKATPCTATFTRQPPSTWMAIPGSACILQSRPPISSPVRLAVRIAHLHWFSGLKLHVAVHETSNFVPRLVWGCFKLIGTNCCEITP